jgi:hypothetical protein
MPGLTTPRPGKADLSVNRRTFLRAAGTAGLFGAVRGVERPSASPLSVRVWFTERASGYDGLTSRVEGYLERALERARGPVSVSFGGVVTVDASERRDLFERGWPLRVLGGAVGASSLSPVRDVNVLVTDGTPHRTPAGHGVPHAAVVSGARALARAPAPDSVSSPAPYTVPTAVVQLLLHEVGHALGLTHDHGRVVERGDSVVVSPMVAGYAWTDLDDQDHRFGRENVCGTPYAAVGGKRRRLALAYGPCASRELRS